MGVTIEHLTVQRKGFTLKDITFSLPEGYILGVIGRNGSGKTTLFQNLLLGYQECRNEEAQKEYRKQFAFVLEECPYPKTLTPKDAAEVFGGLYEDFDMQRYRELLQRLQVPEKSQIGKLSKGMQMKFQMAFAFSYSLKVLVLDEPSANLDSFARKDLYELIFEYMECGNRNVLWATHLTDELDRMADYLLLLEKGEQLMFEEKDKILSQYAIVKGSKHQLDCMKSLLLGRLDRETFSEGMVRAEDGPFRLADTVEQPDIEQMMCYLFDKGRKKGA